ncbi:hypothetical protein GCM10023321_41110 [Pseudonocardia eucalypti]|uniref:Uncharacterized protein n=1 Tax=Pseudonocardia eucalypti TaxID=648755 RepID=A0ABP9QCM4_9PSEU|nr:hypothetical protein [Pseudonocardia eucalypti]
MSKGSHVRKLIASLLPVVTAFGMTVVFTPTAGAAPCAFSKAGRTGTYRHCANSFALIKFVWSNGASGTTCLGPWGETKLYPDGRHEVTRAYRVSKPPSTMKNAQGKTICRAGQPSA